MPVRDGQQERQAALLLLGLGGQPSRAEVMRAFRSRARDEHPDRHADDEATRRRQTERMAALNEAHRFLLADDGPRAGSEAGAAGGRQQGGQPWRPAPPQEAWDPASFREHADRARRMRSGDDDPSRSQRPDERVGWQQHVEDLAHASEQEVRAHLARLAWLEGPPDLLIRGLARPVPGGHFFRASCGCLVQATTQPAGDRTALVHGLVQAVGSGCEHWGWLAAQRGADRHVDLPLDRRQWRTGGVFLVDGVPVRVLPRQAPTTVRLPGRGEPGHQGPDGHLQVHVVHVDRSGEARRRPFLAAPPVGWSMLVAALVAAVGVWVTSLVV